MLELFGFAWVTITFTVCVGAIATRRSVLRWLMARTDRKRLDDTVEIVRRRPLVDMAGHVVLVLMLAVPAAVLAGGGALPGPSGGGGGLPTVGGTMTGQVVFSGVTTDISTGANEDLTVVPNGTGRLVVGSQALFSYDNATGNGALKIRTADPDLQMAIGTAANAATPEIFTALQHYNPTTTTASGNLWSNGYLDSGLTLQRYNTSAGAFRIVAASGTTAGGNIGGMAVYGTGGAIAGTVYLAATGASASTLTIGGSGTVSTVVSGPLSAVTYASATNCSDGAGAAACTAAPAGSVVIEDGATTVVVSTTAVTANSQIFPVFDSSLGTKLGVTCNTTAVTPSISARTAATSFTITAADPAGASPACFSYLIVN